MVRLDKDVMRSKEIPKRPEPIKNEDVEQVAETTKIEAPKPAVIGIGELEKISKEVLKTMSDDNVPATPANFQIYFEKLLDTKPAPLRKRITELLELESVDDDEYRASIEREVKRGFSKIKAMLQAIATIYKNISVMKALVRKRLGELEVNTNMLSVQNVMHAFDEDLTKLSSLMERHLTLLKESYEEVNNSLRSVEDQAIFDSRYGIYNKKYFLRTLETELEGIIRYGYSGTLMLLKVKDNILGLVPSTKDKSVLLRNIAKLLMKTSRRSDVVAHYGDGIFGTIMKHTNLESAQKACERITELIYATSFFMGDMELDIDIEVSIVEIREDKTIAECLTLGLDSLSKSGKELKTYAIGNWDS